MSEKAKYWTAVVYPENMVDDWEDLIEDKLGTAYCYCIHDKDKIQAKNDLIEHEDRKLHAHIILAYVNTTTEKTIYNLVNTLSKPDRVCCPKVFVVRSIRKMYDYLIHDTENCRKQGKYQYSPEERISGNNFDIGMYEQVSLEEKNAMASKLADLIDDMEITNFTIFRRTALQNFPEDRILVEEVIKGNSGYFDRLVRGNYYLEKEKKEKDMKPENAIDMLELVRMLTGKKE